MAAAAVQEGKTALHWAAQFGEPGLLHELLGPSAAADVNSADEAGNTPLHLAALNDHLCAPLRASTSTCVPRAAQANWAGCQSCNGEKTATLHFIFPLHVMFDRCCRRQFGTSVSLLVLCVEPWC